MYGGDSKENKTRFWIDFLTVRRSMQINRWQTMNFAIHLITNFHNKNNCWFRSNQIFLARWKICHALNAIKFVHFYFIKLLLRLVHKMPRNTKKIQWIQIDTINNFLFFFQSSYEINFRCAERVIKTKQLVLLTKWIRVLNRLMANWKSAKDFDESLVLAPAYKNAIVGRTIMFQQQHNP